MSELIFFFQAEDGIRDIGVTGVQTCALPICDIAAMGLGEAMSLRAGGDITPQAAQLFEDALALAPSNPKALLYAGFAAAVRGDRVLARTRWQALKALNPPPQIVPMLDARIAELGLPPGSPTAGGAADTASPGSGAPPAGTSASTGPSSPAEVTIN